ncbi:hypothetical protein I552_1297 [Mycobacterium xenopi 3993]|nr:hypothetical protein I552_1297 [Mycobacterium xenopi 3993]
MILAAVGPFCENRGKMTCSTSNSSGKHVPATDYASGLLSDEHASHDRHVG